MKRIILIILSVSIFAVALVGCGGEESTSGLKLNELTQTTELNLTFVQTAEGIDLGSAYHSVLEKFRDKFKGIAVNITQANITDYGDEEQYYKAVATEIMAGKGSDVIIIDQFFLNNNDVYKMAKTGAFVDMTDFMKTDPIFKNSNLSMSAIESARIEERQYIMPLSYKMPLFFSTQEALDAANIDKTKLGTASSLIDELTRHYSNDSDKIPYLFSWVVPGDNVLKYTGINLIDYKNSELNIDDPLFRKSLDFWKLIYSVEWKGQTDNSTYMNCERLISKDNQLGDFAMFFDDLLNTSKHVELLNALKEKGSPIIIPWRDNSSKVSAFLSEGLAIASNSKNIKNAWEFIKLCLADDSQIQRSYIGIPVNKIALKSVFSKELVSLSEEYISFQDDIGKLYFDTPIISNANKIFNRYAGNEIDYNAVLKELKSLLEIYVSE